MKASDRFLYECYFRPRVGDNNIVHVEEDEVAVLNHYIGFIGDRIKAECRKG